MAVTFTDFTKQQQQQQQRRVLSDTCAVELVKLNGRMTIKCSDQI
jgi:hypothetical protein